MEASNVVLIKSISPTLFSTIFACEGYEQNGNNVCYPFTNQYFSYVNVA